MTLGTGGVIPSTFTGVSMTMIADFGARDIAQLGCLVVAGERSSFILTTDGKCYGETRTGVDDPNDVVSGEDIVGSVAGSFVAVG